MRYSQSPTLKYLKRCIPSDELTVNRLFVSSFISVRGMEPPLSSFLSGFVIERDDKYFLELQKVSQLMLTEFSEEIELETLVQLFEFVVSPADRIVTGAVYTPKRVRSAIISNCLGNKTDEELRNLRVADIACGCGGFLMDVSRLIHQKTGKTYAEIYHENIFGIDIQSYAIERTKILLSLLALLEGEDQDFSFNLLCRDSLDFKKEDWNVEYRGFDVVVGNPPYVCSRNLSDETREKLKQYEVCRTGHPDLYIPFFQIAIEMLANSGQMGFITMNTFLRSVNGRALRRFFSKSGYSISIIDFRGYQVFESRNTYTCLFYLDKFSEAGAIRYAVDEKGELNKDVNYISLPYNSLDDFKGWTLNNFEVTRLIEETGIQIKDYCPSRHGIATLSNETYIFRPVEENEMYYFLDSDGNNFPIEKSICRNVVNPNKLHSVDQYDELVEKLLFPYKYVDNKVSIIDPERMAVDYPGAWDYLNYKRKVLLSRDKRNTENYPQWYAFGRTQSLVLPRYKLFFPKFANHALQCLIEDDADLMLYNGLAFVSDDMRRLRILKSVIESDLFWEYIRSNAKPYASGYYSLSGVDIKHFGIPKFTQEEENELLSLEDKDKIEVWLRTHYDLE